MGDLFPSRNQSPTGHGLQVSPLAQLEQIGSGSLHLPTPNLNLVSGCVAGLGPQPL